LRSWGNKPKKKKNKKNPQYLRGAKINEGQDFDNVIELLIVT